MDVIGRPERAPDRIWRCPNCGHLCRRAGHITERCDGKSVEYVRSDLHRGAVEECEALRQWIDAFGRESASISVDDVLTASRKRVPPPGGGQ